MNPAQLLNPKGFAKEQAKSKKKAPNYGPPQSRKPTTPTQSSPHTKQTPYTPQALLNPKAALGSSSRAAGNEAEDEDTNGQVGAASMIERLNNVASRDDVPITKRKAQVIDGGDSDGERKKQQGTFSEPSAGGIISEHLKEERLNLAGPAEAQTIDLTNDDDEVQILNDPDREVCLGVIKTSANVYRVPQPGNSRFAGKHMWPPFRASIQEGENKKIELADKAKVKFAMVEARAASAMASILLGSSTNKTRFVVWVTPRPKKPDETVGKPVSQSVKIDISIFAPMSKAHALGRFLSQKALFLAAPVAQSNMEYVNPQQPKSFAPLKAAAPKPQLAGPSIQRSAEEIRRDTGQMFDELAKSQDKDMPQMDANATLIKSELMSHQKQALHFMMEHERDDFNETETPVHTLWKHQVKANGQHSWYNVITGSEVFKKPKTLQGGILADVMGLGKTLSILSLVAETQEAARRFRREDVPDDTDAETNAQATLIICPKSVLSNWQDQIRVHTTEGKLKTYTYHGTNRTQDLRHLAKHDIVLTSYNTAAAEFGSRMRKTRPLCDINWFRIVLDEAHSIRNQTTQVSKACCALNAERRWAVTGTPVQNGLLDLGALMRFIRLKPFDEPTVWSQYIMAPFKMGDQDVIQKLQVMIGSVTLRRMKSTIDLPERTETRDKLEFSKEEALLYRTFATKCRTQFHQVTGGGAALKGRAYAHVLKSLGRLRAICAHGREMLTEEDMKDIEGSDPNNAIVLDLGEGTEKEDEFLNEKQAYEHFYMTQESEVDQCVACSKKLSDDKKIRADGAEDITDDEEIEQSETDAGDDEMDPANDLLGHITTCYHLICAKCTEKHQQEAKALMGRDHYYECQYCQQWQRFGMYPILRSVLKHFREERQGKSKKARTARWDETSYSGPHTKVKALLEDLRKSAEETAALPEGEPPIRSVVFSGWTAYLDLIEHALSRNNIGFARIDGSMSVKERSTNLKAFNGLDHVVVLLVSIKAGGQGLNFTAANKAYVMEPQFNPGVEAQAVDRIHRIGQTRPVSIKHYIMKDSVEEGILKLQEKKEALAKLSMERKKSKGEEAKERMEELKALFK